MSDAIYCQLIFKTHSIVSKHKLYYLYDRGNSATFYYSDIEKCWLVTVNNGSIKVEDRLLASAGENTYILNSRADVSFGPSTFSFFNCAESKGMTKILVDYLLKAKDNKMKIEKVLNMIQANCGAYKDFYFVLDCLRRAPIFSYRCGELSLNIETLFKLVSSKENPSKSIVEYELGNGIQAKELGKSFNINKIWRDCEFGATSSRTPCPAENEWSDLQVYDNIVKVRRNRLKLLHSSKTANAGYKKESAPVAVKRSSKYVNPYVIRSSTEDFLSDDMCTSGESTSLSDSKRLKNESFRRSASYSKIFDSCEMSPVLSSTNSSYGRSSSISMANDNSMSLNMADCFTSNNLDDKSKYLYSSHRCLTGADHRAGPCHGPYKCGNCPGSRIIKHSKQSRKINYKNGLSDSTDFSCKLQLQDSRDERNPVAPRHTGDKVSSDEDSSGDRYISPPAPYINTVAKRKASHMCKNKRYKHSFEINLEPVVEEIYPSSSVESQSSGFQSDNELERCSKAKIPKYPRSASTIEDGFLCERNCQVNHDSKKRNKLIKNVSGSGSCKIKRV